jgi:hypothetical protein
VSKTDAQFVVYRVVAHPTNVAVGPVRSSLTICGRL